MQAREELKEVEGEIDKAVAGLHGITDKELEDVRRTLGGFERRGCCAVVLYKTNGFQFIFHCRCKGLPTATRTEQGS